jgi:hypothetical protein
MLKTATFIHSIVIARNQAQDNLLFGDIVYNHLTTNGHASAQWTQ